MSYPVFILTHGRADNQITYKTLRDNGYTGEVFFVVDDMDPQLEKYKENFGEQVLVFNKDATGTDIMTNEKEYRSPVFARNKAYEFAKEKGYRYFVAIDDDIEVVIVRYQDGNSLRGQYITNFDDVFKALREYQESAKIACLSFANGGQLIGGLQGKYKKGVSRRAYTVFFLDTEQPMEFKGLLDEDHLTTLYYSRNGYKIFTLMAFQMESPPRGKAEGGITDLYLEREHKYKQHFNSVIVLPDVVKISNDKQDFNTTNLWGYAFPKIIREEHKKARVV